MKPGTWLRSFPFDGLAISIYAHVSCTAASGPGTVITVRIRAAPFATPYRRGTAAGQTPGTQARGYQRALFGFYQPRESSDRPRLNAFCLVAPSVRFSVRAILTAGVFRRASDFSSRTCAGVQARLLDVFLRLRIYDPPNKELTTYVV